MVPSCFYPNPFQRHVFFSSPHRLRCNITAPASLTERRKVFICTQMGLIWNNEYVLEKNKEPHKAGYFSTEATEMADNCFQVWRCSVNEFVQFCWQLTVSSFQFVSGFSHTATLFDFLRFVFVFPLSSLHIYPLLGSLVALSFTFFLNLFFFPLPILSVYHICWCGCFLHLILVLLLCSVLLAGRQQQTTFLFRCGLLAANSFPWLRQPDSAVFFCNCYYSSTIIENADEKTNWAVKHSG